MAKLQVTQAITANTHWKKLPVYKLDYKQIGSAKIKKLMGLSYCLELFNLIKFHNVIHPNLLKLVAINPLPSQYNFLPSLIIANKRKKNERSRILLMPRKIKQEKCYFESSKKNITKISNGIWLPILTM